MRFSFSDEQEELRRVVRSFLEDKSPPAEVRRLMETSEGCDREVWRQLSEDLGMTAVHVPEEYGGPGSPRALGRLDRTERPMSEPENPLELPIPDGWDPGERRVMRQLSTLWDPSADASSSMDSVVAATA